MEGGDDLFIEVGPHPALTASIKECLAETRKKGLVFHSLRRETDETCELLTNVAGLHVHGVPIDWAAVNQSVGNFVPLPRYPFNQQKCWLESADSKNSRLAVDPHPLLGARVPAVKATFQFQLDPRCFPYLNDHRFFGSILFPAAAYGEIGIALARELFPDKSYAVEDIHIKKALFVAGKQSAYGARCLRRGRQILFDIQFD